MRGLVKLMVCQVLALAAFSASAQNVTQDLNLKALEQGPAITAKALKAAMLSVTRAGTRLVAAGERGIVLFSDDDGKIWRQAKTPVSVSLTEVRFASAKQGWAIGHLGVVLHTEDGGETWVKQLDGIQAAHIVLKSAQSDSPISEARLATAKRLVEEGPDKPFLAMHFDDEKHGYVLGAFGLALRTTDGGKNWEAWDAHIDNPDGLHAYAMVRTGNTLMIVGERGMMLRSLDGGAHFSPVKSPYSGSYFGLLVGSRGELIAYGLRGSVYRSSDQGATWLQVKTGIEVSIGAATELPNQTIVLRSQAGDLFVSNDGGLNFQVVQGSNKVPASGLASTADGALVVASLRGVFRTELPTREAAR